MPWRAVPALRVFAAGPGDASTRLAENAGVPDGMQGALPAGNTPPARAAPPAGNAYTDWRRDSRISLKVLLGRIAAPTLSRSGR